MPMYLIAISFFIIESVNILRATNLRCYEDANRSVQWKDDCHACVLFIDSINISSLSTIHVARQLINEHHELSIEDLIDHRQVFFSNTSHHLQRREAPIAVHKHCQRQADGPLYGYNQTHCFCDSHQCNFNIQRCIYEVIAKGLFSCYHGSNVSENSLEIRQKCRTCRIRLESNLTYHYECLTFAEQRQQDRKLCTCQQTLCNRDFAACAGNAQSEMSITLSSSTAVARSSELSQTIETMRSTTNNDTLDEFSVDNSTYNPSTTGVVRQTMENVACRNCGRAWIVNTLLLLLGSSLKYSL